MRVALTSWESLHSMQVGGVAVHVSELAHALRGGGHYVHVFTRVNAGQRQHDCVGGAHHRCPFDQHVNFGTYVDRMRGERRAHGTGVRASSVVAEDAT